jgi:hypothetical protein
MKRILAGAFLFSFAATAAGPALAQPPPPYPPVPPPRYEPVPPPRGERYIWEPGHWQWNGVQYVWVEGRYVARRPHYGHYVPGHWQWAPRLGRYVWRPAHWA